MNDTFSKLHPAVTFFYFIIVLLMTMLTMHPIFLIIGFISSFCYCCFLKPWQKIIKMICWLIPMILFLGCFNAFFSHAGITMLFYLPNGNPVTMEAFLYGLATATMFAAMYMWFICYNTVMTTDKFLYLFGKKLPSVSLLLSLSLRFIPRFRTRICQITQAQEQIGRGNREGNLKKRLQCSARIFSIAVTWALESGIITADSMKSRGYGAGKRTSFSVYHWEMREKMLVTMMILLLLGLGIAVGTGGITVKYYPAIVFSQNGAMICGCICYTVFSLLPVIINGKEAFVWKHLKLDT